MQSMTEHNRGKCLKQQCVWIMCSPKRCTHCLCLSGWLIWPPFLNHTHCAHLFWCPVKCTWGFVSFWVSGQFLTAGPLWPQNGSQKPLTHVPWWMTQALWRRTLCKNNIRAKAEGDWNGQVGKKGDKGEEEKLWEHQEKIKRSVCSTRGALGRLLTMRFSSV